MKKPFRFISLTYKLVCAGVVILPLLATALMVRHWSDDFTMKKVDKELRLAADSVMNVVRMRYDLVQNYLYLEEQYIQRNLSSSADSLQRMSRELELEVARRHFTESRAKDLFVNLVRDLAAITDYDIVILDESNRVIQHNLLPNRFKVENYQWIQEMRENETGVLRYTWQYPGEPESYERLTAYRLLHGWKWLLSLEAKAPDPEKSDFADQQIQGLNDFVTGYHSSAGGYAMILSVADESVITHPEFSEGTFDLIPGVEEMVRVKNGVVRYVDDNNIAWRAGVHYFTPRRWLVVVTAREDRILEESRAFTARVLFFAGAAALISLLIYYRLLRSLIYSVYVSSRQISQLR